MKWPSVIRAMFGITATAWIFPVRCLVTQMFFGNVRFVVTEIAGPVNLCRYIECHGQVSLATAGTRLWCMCMTERVTAPRSGYKVHSSIMHCC